MTTDYAALHRKYLAAVEKIASSYVEGAVLRLEADPTALEALDRRAVPHDDVVAILRQAYKLADATLRPKASETQAWNRHELALVGTRDALAHAATALIRELLLHAECGRVGWRAILIRIFPGEALRTHLCDPGYDLAPIRSSAVVWVQPYPGDDWQESQRYPTVTLVWQTR